MINNIMNFVKKNWSLYLVLLIDIYIEYLYGNFIMELSADTVYYKKIFDAYIFNFIYLLLPFYNIGLKIGQDKDSNKINFTNLLKVHNLSAIIFSLLCYYFRSYYFNKMNVQNIDFGFFPIFFVIFCNSLLSCLNGFLVGKGDNVILVKFNLINLFFSFLTNKIVIMFNIKNELLFFIKNLSSLINIIYILSVYRNEIDLHYYFSNKIKNISIGIQLLLRNIITLFGLNVNDYILFQLSSNEVKKYQLISSNTGNFLNIYGPLSTIIQKKIYNESQINKILSIYCFASVLLLNIINFFYWKFNLITLNVYNILYFLVFVNESKNISNNNIIRSCKVLLTIFIFKFLVNKFFNITSVDTYYTYINFVLFVKFLLNYVM